MSGHRRNTVDFSSLWKDLKSVSRTPSDEIFAQCLFIFRIFLSHRKHGLCFLWEKWLKIIKCCPHSSKQQRKTVSLQVRNLLSLLFLKRGLFFFLLSLMSSFCCLFFCWWYEFYRTQFWASGKQFHCLSHILKACTIVSNKLYM